MSVTYTADWLTVSCGRLYLLAQHPHRWWLIPFLMLPLPFLVWWDQPFRIVFGVTGAWVGLWISLSAVFFLLDMFEAVATKTRKVRTTTISPAGLRDERWPSQNIVGWKEIVSISHTGTNLFLFRKGIGSGMFVPASAFTDPREARRFYNLALTYWQEAKYGLAALAVDDARVWPPAPRTGDFQEPGGKS